MSKIMDVELVVIKFRQAYGKTPDARSRYCGKNVAKLQITALHETAHLK